MTEPTQLGYFPNFTIARISIAVQDWHTDILSALDLGYAGLKCEAYNVDESEAHACVPAPNQPTLPQSPQAVAVSSPTQTCEFLWRAVRAGPGNAQTFKFKFRLVDSSGASQMTSFVNDAIIKVGSGGSPPPGWEYAPGAAPEA